MEDNNKKQIHVKKHLWPDEIMAKKLKRRNRVSIVALLVVCFGLGYATNTFLAKGGSLTITSTGESVSVSEKFNKIYDILANEWYFGKDIEELDAKLIDKAISGMSTDEIDPHTTYMDSETTSSLMTSLSGSLVGIGIQYYALGDEFLVEKVYMNSPAQESGLKEGDLIKKVDGKAIEGMDSEKVKAMITGEEGTQVSVEVLRGQENKKIVMTRAEVSISAYGYIKDNVGIIELSSFSQNSAQEVESYLESFKQKGVERIILDVRNNGGGYVETAIGIASLFIEKGEVVLYQEDKNGDFSDEKTYGGTKYAFDRVAVLVNENTASASELLSAALKYYIDADIIGVNTYGKGTVQRTIEFSDGSAFKYTVAEWLTPKKEKINQKGIKPTQEVKLDEAINYAANIEEDVVYEVDGLGENIKTVQVFLKFLGYDVDRVDGYFSQETLAALKAYQTKEGMEVTGKIDEEIIEKLITSGSRKWHDEKETLDIQMNKALEVVNGK
ncbi:MAG: S41 family peptidase [Breznakia sp.]